MLAKPEYFSPPDEVCCWPGRRVGEAGRGADAGGLGLPGRDATGRARRGAEASGRGFRQASARLATACTAGKEMHDGRGVARRTSTAAPGEPLAHRTAGRGTLLLFGWCAEGVHLVYYFHWDAKDSVQLFVCGGVVVAEEPYYCNELVVGYLTEWLVVSLV